MYSEMSTSNGRVSYAAYNRFPVFPFLTIAIAIRPFQANLATQIHVARLIMNAFLFLAMLVMFVTLTQFLGLSLVSVTVVLLAFSSHYLLYYGDMIFNDVPALFGYVLALFIVVAAERRAIPTKWLILLALLAVSMGWQPSAVFVTWFLTDLLATLFAAAKASLRSHVVGFLRRPSLSITAAATIWAAIVAASQLLNEWRVVGGVFSALPTVESILWRVGVKAGESYAAYRSDLNWATFLEEEARRIVVMSVPFASILELRLPPGSRLILPLVLALGALVTVALKSTRSRLNRKIVVVFLCSGLLWSLVMRRFVVFHDFQAMFHIGFPVMLFVILSLSVRPSTSATIAMVVTFMFVLSVYRINVDKAVIGAKVRSLTEESNKSMSDCPPAAECSSPAIAGG